MTLTLDVAPFPLESREAFARVGGLLATPVLAVPFVASVGVLVASLLLSLLLLLLLLEVAAGRDLVADAGGLEEVHQLAVDPDLLHAALEAGDVPDVPLVQGLLPHAGRQTRDVDGAVGVQVVVLALIDDGASHTRVHLQGERLAHSQDLNAI